MPKTWGERLFETGTYRRVAFTPVLYACVLGAALRLWSSDDYPPIPFVGPRWTNDAWTLLALICPLLALAAWWLIDHSTQVWATIVGIWLRLAADIGMFSVLLTYHMSVVTNIRSTGSEARIFSRYIVAATIFFTLYVVTRDVWVIHRTERLAQKMRVGGV